MTTRPAAEGEPPLPVPTTADFENILLAKFAAALAAGEAFVDVSSRDLSRALGGPGKTTKYTSVCCNLMRRMMVPGDHELSNTYGNSGSNLLIRFRLPR